VKTSFFKSLALPLVVLSVIVEAAAAATAPDLLKAKLEAEAKGYAFITNHSEIVAHANKERKLRVLSSMDAAVVTRMADLYKKRYPFMDVHAEELSGPEAQQRFLLELKTGRATNWDIAEASEDFYNDYPPYLKKFDIFGMAEQGVLAVNPRMVDPDQRNIVALASTLYAVAYNKNLLSPDKLPATWEDFLKPEFKGRKFAADIRPFGMTALVPAMGEEWVREYAKKIGAQQPIWVRGQTRVLTAISNGEHALSKLAYYHSCMEVAAKNPTGSLVCKVIEPAPLRLSNTESVLATAASPYAALLWLETAASPEGQKIIDDYYPLKSSMYGQGKIAAAVKGLKVSVLDFRGVPKIRQWMDMVVQAYGFPKAEKGK
jgi:hypothetical protein